MNCVPESKLDFHYAALQLQIKEATNMLRVKPSEKKHVSIPSGVKSIPILNYVLCCVQCAYVHYAILL